MNEAIKILSQKQETYQQMIDANIGGEQSALLKEELKLRLSEVAAAIKLLEQFGQHPPDIQKLKEDFFKMFGEQSFRGYPLSQCWDIWEFFLPAIQADQFRQPEHLERTDESEDDRDYEDEMESEEERRFRTATDCTCGAWSISKKTGAAIHVADCVCGAG